MLSYGTSLNLNSWIAKHQERLRPPVGNQQIWPDADLIVTIVGIRTNAASACNRIRSLPFVDHGFEFARLASLASPELIAI